MTSETTASLFADFVGSDVHVPLVACYAKRMLPPLRPNERFFDRFSVPHAAAGAVMQLSGFSAPIALGAQVGFELVENDLKRAFSPMFPDDSPDGWQNHVGDVIAFMGGYYLAQATRNDPVGRVGLVVLGAAAAAIWFDNLTRRPRPASLY